MPTDESNKESRAGEQKKITLKSLGRGLKYKAKQKIQKITQKQEKLSRTSVMLGPDDEWGRQASFDIPLDQSIGDDSENEMYDSESDNDDEYGFTQKFKQINPQDNILEADNEDSDD